MIRYTHAQNPGGVLSAYSDNAAVIEGYPAGRFFPDSTTRQYNAQQEPVHIAIKVETHNHPTGISPHPGAATGSGGEIRDEGATGRGGKPKAGLAGFSVSDLQIPENPLPWEDGRPHPSRLATPLQIMVEGPIGAAAFNNEFGRPNLCGYFRTFHQQVNAAEGTERRGYHKPIMIAGGYGNVRPEHVEKNACPKALRSSRSADPPCSSGLAAVAPHRCPLAPSPKISTLPPFNERTQRCSDAAKRSSTTAGRWEQITPLRAFTT